MSDLHVLVGAKKNEQLIFYIALKTPSPAGAGNDDIFLANPTLAAGDATVSTDGGAFSNAGTLPTVTPASGVAVKVTLSATEMNGDNVVFRLSDQTATEEWQAVVVTVHTYAADQDDLVRSTTPANTLDVDAAGEVTVGTITAGVITSAAFASGAVTATVLAADCITSSELATSAVDEIVDAVWDELQSAHVGAGTFGEIATETAAILVDTGTTLDGLITTVDTVVDAIKAKTDSLAFTGTDVHATLDSETVALTAASITAATFGAGAIDAASLAADAGAEIADAVWDEAIAGHVAAGSFGVQCGTDIDAILADTGTDGVLISLTQAISEGQTVRTVGGAFEAAEATHRNRILFSGGVRTVYRSNGTTALIARTQTATELVP